MKVGSRARLWFGALLAVAFLSSCRIDDGVLFFAVEDDILLGGQLAREVDSTYRASGQLLERNSANPQVQQAYLALDRIVSRVLNSEKVKYRAEFPWRVMLVRDDATLNAFAAPGGYIYVFTGLVNFLSDEDHFAGVIGHEIAHADLRHSVQQLERQYGIALLLSVALGNDAGILEQIVGQLAGTLAGLRFSRGAETEADNASIAYLGGTNHYACDGAAGFFLRLNQQAEQQPGMPEFLSTHPNPDNRIENIRTRAQEAGCSKAAAADTDLNQLKAALRLL
jgi:beta-barrel assembly-enhancing protease